MSFQQSVLSKALRDWLNDDSPPSEDKKSLIDYLPFGNDGAVLTAAEAKLVCAVIDKARSKAANPDDIAAGHDLHAAIALMQQVGSAEARDALILQGVPRLRSLVRARLANPESHDEYTLFALKVIQLYRQPEDLQLFIDAIRAPFQPDSYLWQPAFNAFDEKHPFTPALIASLADPLPPGFIRIVYLDMCNALAINGHLDSHPFASPQGLKALEGWLTSPREEETSYAVSACASLPFLPSSERDRLFELASRHSSVAVQMEAAWASTKAGIASGADTLVAFARDARHSARAVAYLKELDLEARIPPEVVEPDFLALAQMCQWLAHPNEMGRPPDEISLADTRELYWPPTKDRRPLWVFRYLYKIEGESPNEGYGLVGSVTWAMFGLNTIDRSPEDIYALHCGWELLHVEDPDATAEFDVASGRAILAKHNPGFG